MFEKLGLFPFGADRSDRVCMHDDQSTLDEDELPSGLVYFGWRTGAHDSMPGKFAADGGDVWIWPGTPHGDHVPQYLFVEPDDPAFEEEVAAFGKFKCVMREARNRLTPGVDWDDFPDF